MPFAYLTEPGARVRKTGQRLVVEKDGVELAELETHRVQTVVAVGPVHFTHDALALLLDQGIELALMTTRGRLRGQLTPPKARNVVLRMAQYEAHRDPQGRIALARTVVAAKLGNGRAVLRRLAYNRDVAAAAEAAERMAGPLAAAAGAADLETLMGHEGNGAREYFAGLAQAVPAGLGFEGRRRRPPPDPVNALLSFGYVLVGNEIQALLDAVGFDPYIGFFHSIDYGRPGLALDLLEEFRHPLVDRLTLALVSQRVLAAGDFEPDGDGGVRMSREALKRYFAKYERHMKTPVKDEGSGESVAWRELFRRQAHRMAGALVRGEAYVPFRASA